MQRKQNALRNQLWFARKQLGLRQKHVAYLLDHKTTDQVSRYEKGDRIPGLKTLLQIEIIYGMPARMLYREWFLELKAEIEVKAKNNKSISNAYAVPASEGEALAEFCPYYELLKSPKVSQQDRDRIRKHAIHLIRGESDLPR